MAPACRAAAFRALQAGGVADGERSGDAGQESEVQGAGGGSLGMDAMAELDVLGEPRWPPEPMQRVRGDRGWWPLRRPRAADPLAAGHHVAVLGGFLEDQGRSGRRSP